MTYITEAADNILHADAKAVEYANAYVSRLAKRFGVNDNEVVQPVSTVVKKLATAVALRETALSTVGSDPTAYLDGVNMDDIYYRKYKIYDEQIKQIEANLSYVDFAGEGADNDGKGSVGTIRLARA